MTQSPDGLTLGKDGCQRCWWQGELPDYQRYHDNEWGFPITEDWRLFEKICLEGFQSGLSWLTILRKRDNFRQAFADFQIDIVARYNQRSVSRLLNDPGIIRHRRKIEAAINNARCALQLQTEFGSLSTFFWQFVPEPEERPAQLTYEAVRALAKTPTSIRLAKELKSRGWQFIGPTTAYAFMQAVGLVNDHLDGCSVRLRVESLRQQILQNRAQA